MNTLRLALFKAVAWYRDNDQLVRRDLARWRAAGRLTVTDVVKLAVDSPTLSQAAATHILNSPDIHETAIDHLGEYLYDPKKEFGGWQEKEQLGRSPIMVEYVGYFYPQRARARELLQALVPVCGQADRQRIEQWLKKAPPDRQGKLANSI